MNANTIAKTAVVTLIAGSFLLSGCAPMISGAMNATVDEGVVIEKTAKYFGLKREDVKIANVEKGALSTTYQTRVSKVLYNCTIYYGEVNCSQPGGEPFKTKPTDSGSASSTMTVAQAQIRLNQLGYSVGSPDGVMGRKSVQQLKSFQQANGLPVSGKLDEATIAELSK